MNKSKLRIGYVPLAKKSWLNDKLETVRKDALKMLQKTGVETVSTEGLITDRSQADELAAFFIKGNIDCLLFHHITFSLGSIVPAMIKKVDVPVIFWSMPEPPMEGGRISSNSFCASNMNAHTLWKMGRKYAYVYGNDKEAENEMESQFKSLQCVKSLKSTRIGLLGNRVPGFYTSNYNELKMMETFGIEVEHVDLLELVAMARNADSDLPAAVNEIKRMSRINANVSETEIEQEARLYSAFKVIREKYNLDACAVKCWPELPEFYGIAPCSAMGMLSGNGIICGCEGDIYGTMTMIVQNLLTGAPPFFCDLISLDYKENEAIAWHCGAASPSLKADNQNYALCKHSVVDGGDKKGVTGEFPLKPGRVTLARFSEDRNGGYRLFLAGGQAVETGRLIKGNPVKIKFDAPLKDITDTIIENGFEHHYSLVYADIGKELLNICKWLDVKMFNFS